MFHMSAAKYYFYDNYFDLPGALLCARVVDMLNKVRTRTCMVDFCHLHSELVYSIHTLLFFNRKERKLHQTFGKTWWLPSITTTIHLLSEVCR